MIKQTLQNQFNKKGYTIVGHTKDQKEIMDLAMKIREETDMRITIDEAIQIYHLVKATNKLNGDIAEVGTYTGASSKIICEASNDTDKSIYLFDTFEGLPEITSQDPNYKKGEFKVSYEEVKDYLSSYHTIITKGLFPQSIKNTFFKDKLFSFIHLDVDIYSSTLDSLNFFYPRMVKGGVILLHDYAEKEGVYKAVNEFFSDKPEIIIELTCSQAMMVKL